MLAARAAPEWPDLAPSYLEDLALMEDSERSDAATAVTEPPTTSETETVEPLASDPVLAGLRDLPPVPGPANPSPDGSMLAYLVEDARGRYQLELCPVAGGPVRSFELSFAPQPDLPPDGEPGIDSGPQWSPDGTRLALVGAHPERGASAIWSVDASSGEAFLLVDHPAADRGPRWSPDGELVAFTTARDGRDAVAIAPANGSGPAVMLTDGRHDDHDPAWSYDGTMIAFRRRSGELFKDHDLWVVDLATGELRQLTGKPGKSGLGSKPANRWGVAWAPDRNQMAYISDEREWNLIAVINGENGSGWTLAGEQGDKADPHWDPAGKKVCYTRTQGPTTLCCVKGTSSATPVVLDPGDGAAASPRWVGADHVVYRFSDPRRALELIVQEANADAARTRLPAPEPAPGAAPVVVAADTTSPGDSATSADEPPDESAEPVENEEAAETEAEPVVAETGQPLEGGIDGLITPETHEIEIDDGATLGGLLYQRSEGSGPSPAVISLGDGPPHRHETALHPAEQVLAAAGLFVFAPNGRGIAGSGRAMTAGLRDATDPEVAVSDLVDVAASLRERDDVMGGSVAAMGTGFGGALALLTASRPGTVQAYVAIDPVVDWDIELDLAAPAERRWVIETLGVPSINRDRLAIHSPLTYAGLIDGPLLLLGSEDAAPGRTAQLDLLVSVLDELGIAYTRETIPGGQSEAETAERIAAFLRETFTVAPAPVDAERAADEVPERDRAVSADEV